MNHFVFHVHTNVAEESYVLSEIEYAVKIDLGASQGTLQITGLPRYNLDGSRTSYTLNMGTDENGEPWTSLAPDFLEPGDYLEVTYDNSQVPNYSNDTAQVYSGGILRLTLKGETDFEAQKVWLDPENTSPTDRPGGEFQLWRYREGSGYQTAAVVRDAAGEILSVGIDTAEDPFAIVFGSGEGVEKLPKYDSEGYRYIYVVREYLEGEHAGDYEQVFGKVGADGTVSDRVDVNGDVQDTTTPGDRGSNTFVYDGGTISNRIYEECTVSAEKSWKAAAFQADFEDVRVELTLQSRVKGSAEWKNTQITETMEEFIAENLTATVSRSMPRYDSLGQELEYRWIETGVYQGDSEENLYHADPEDPSRGSCTLNQGEEGPDGNKRDVLYTSEIQINGEQTVITNSIANEIDYTVTKVWHDANGEVAEAPEGAEVEFTLYRMLSGDTFTEDASVGTFVLDGEADQGSTWVNGALGISVQEKEPWKAVVTPLDEFNENGSQYEYVLLESSTGYAPSYETYRDKESGNYHTTVTNAPGTGNRILVRKDWIDDSDIIHREPVTITVYERETNRKIDSITLDEDQWYGWVGIGETLPEDVYILETQVGKSKVPLQDYSLSSDETPIYDTPKAPETYEGGSDSVYSEMQYKAQYHSYAAVYTERQELAGESMYVVINRRLGNVNLTVTKDWKDGDGERREQIQKELDRLEDEGTTIYPAFRLDFVNAKDYYEIEYTGADEPDRVTVGNHDSWVPILDDQRNEVSSIQRIDLTDNQKEYYFYNLPKYDREGTTVQYDVREVWVVEGENQLIEKVLSASELKDDYPQLYELVAEYQARYSDQSYEPGDLHDADQQSLTVTNYLTGTKDIIWHKQWMDAYTYENDQRPDIYLNIYQEVHRETGTIETELYQANYKWEYVEIDDAENPDGLYDKEKHWHAVLSGLPKYDELGYEIIYYATEHTVINAGDFDYQDVEYAVPNPDGGAGALLPIGTEYDITEESYKNAYVRDVMGLENADSPHYALIEGGTFTNKLNSSVTIQGQKLWTSLPYGYPDIDLPTVTFHLYQSLAGQVPAEDADPIATLTVSNWADLNQNGSYIFQIQYVGKQTMEKNPGDGALECVPDNPDAAQLPKYDEDGNLYYYTLKEAAISWPDGTLNTDVDEVFQTPAVEQNTYLVNNVYDSVKAATAVKKYLKLPKVSDQYIFPAVTFVLERSYTTNEGKLSEKEVVETKVWTSAEVKKAYEDALAAAGEAGVEWNGWVETELTFENLEQYAPNGSEYVYTVREDKSNLNGYDTWVIPGDVEDGKSINDYLKEENKGTESNRLVLAENQADENGTPGRGETAEEIEVAASFFNQHQEKRDTITLTGEKQWDDYGNIFETRPSEITITLRRSADSQPGQNNGIPYKEVPECYSITWEAGFGEDFWTYKIEGTEENELERYAPNGMAWKYQVIEKLPDGSYYTASPGTGNSGNAVDNPDGSAELPISDLKNSLKTSQPFQKTWVDKDGNTIQEDYLGWELSVDFKLQVAEKTGESYDDWEDAETYFRANLTVDNYQKVFGNAYEFTKTLTGSIDSEVWETGGRFTDLPKVIKKVDENTATVLVYRVVESEIRYGLPGGQSTSIPINVVDQDDHTYIYDFGGSQVFSPYYGEGQTSNPDNTTNHQNQLNTAGMKVQKNWVGDSDNAFGTRPSTPRPGYDWESRFVIQQSSDNGMTWENVQVYENGQTPSPLIVTLYGTNEESQVSAEISGLPVANIEGNPLIYRALELPPGAEDSSQTIDEGGDYNGTYAVSYQHQNIETDGDRNNISTITNTMKTAADYTGIKEWERGSKPENENSVTVTLELEYLRDLGNGQTEWTRIGEFTQVILDGEADPPTGNFYEVESWKALWTNLPKQIPGGVVNYFGQTPYRAVEVDISDGYQQVGSDDSQPNQTTITNRAVVSLNVKKTWMGLSDEEKARKTVEVELWRENADGTKEQVRDDDGNPRTAVLNADSNWEATFENLPKYDLSDSTKVSLYTYYAVETKIDGKPINNQEFEVSHENDSLANGNFVTHVTNRALTELTVTKIWKDNNNAYRTRPDSIRINLYQSVKSQSLYESTKNTLFDQGESSDGSLGTPYETVVITEDPETGNWTYTFENLPVTNETGEEYVYTVREEAINMPPGAPDGDRYVPSYGEDYTITNTLTGITEIPIVKYWDDKGNADGLRPDSVTIHVMQNGTFYREFVLSEDGILQQIADFFAGRSNDVWMGTIGDLPKYDENGALYEYTLKEAAINGYEPSYSGDEENGYVITNTVSTEHKVEKVWRQVSEEDQREVTVGLYRSVNGSNPEQVLNERNEPVTLTLSKANNWKGTFTGIPKYDGQGNLYEYSAKELTIGGIPVEEVGFAIQEETQNGTTVITNTKAVQITGTKTWDDYDNQYHTRPEKLILNLYRHVDGGEKELVNVQPEWSNTDTNLWTYQYKNLPAVDADGNDYIYTVEEQVPNGYTMTQDGLNFTNKLTTIPTPTPTTTPRPTGSPTPSPSVELTESPTPSPSVEPTGSPTPSPSVEPTGSPTPSPSVEPTESPTPSPSGEPTGSPTPSPSGEPTGSPTPSPSVEPTESPTPSPSDEPTGSPTPSATPTDTVRNPGSSSGTTSGTSSGGTSYRGTTRSSDSDSYKSENAKTQDESKPEAYGLLLLAGLGGIAVVLQEVRRRKRDQ